MSENEPKPAAPYAGPGALAGYPHLLMTLWVMVGVSAVLGALLLFPPAAIVVIWGLIGLWRLRVPSRWVRVWVLLGALACVVAGVALLFGRVLLQQSGGEVDGKQEVLGAIFAMAMIVLGAYVLCQMLVPSVQRELDRRLALARGRSTEEEEKHLTPAQQRELERKRAADSLAETIESIIVAFILAFLFRAFVVEAFVIPTGSMAPTLMGDHYRYEAPTGYAFEVGHQTNSRDQIPPIDPLTRRQMTGASSADPFDSGDRILVEKFSILLGHMQRWSVIVFRNPLFPHDAPFDMRKDLGENFIKRLIGLPGEVIMILDGDIYVLHPDQPLKTAGPQPTKEEQEALVEQILQHGTICRKPVENPKAQAELWMPIYSSRYWPGSWGKGGEDDDRRWYRMGRPEDVYASEAEAGHHWQCDQPVFVYNGSGDTTTRSIRYIHLQDPQSHLTPDERGRSNEAARRQEMEAHEAFIDDFCGYNGDGRYLPGPTNMVSDLMITTDVQFGGAGKDGRIELTLTKYDTSFTAVLYADGRWEMRSNAWRGLDRTAAAVAPGEIMEGGTAHGECGALKATTHVEFANVDYHLRLCVDGKEVYSRNSPQLTRGEGGLMERLLDWTTRPESGRASDGSNRMKNRADMWPHVILGAADADLQIRNLNVYRDVFYTNSQSDHASATFPYATTGRPLRLGPDDFFVLGDNSPASSDGRLWLVAWDPDFIRPIDGQSGAWVIGAVPPFDMAEPKEDEYNDRSEYNEAKARYEKAKAEYEADRKEKLSRMTHLTHLPPLGRYTPGTVPRSYLIGRAFFVYWPSGGRPFGTRLPIIPQVQRMRMIR